MCDYCTKYKEQYKEYKFCPMCGKLLREIPFTPISICTASTGAPNVSIDPLYYSKRFGI